MVQWIRLLLATPASHIRVPVRVLPEPVHPAGAETFAWYQGWSGGGVREHWPGDGGLWTSGGTGPHGGRLDSELQGQILTSLACRTLQLLESCSIVCPGLGRGDPSIV